MVLSKTIKYFLFLLVVLPAFCFAQNSDSLYSNNLKTPFIIDSIKISGNEITEDFIILRELNFGVGDTLTTDKLEFSRERVFSLGLFHKVEISANKDSLINIVLIDVQESWYIYPVPFVNIPDGDFDRISYGAFLLWKNFRGRNETVNFAFSLGYNPSFSFSYFNPVIIEGTDINLSTGAFYQSVASLSPSAEFLSGNSFSYDTWGASIRLGKRLNLYNEVYISPRFEYIEAPFALKGITASGNNIDRLASLKLTYIYDTRNLKQFPEKGVLAFSELAHIGFGINNIAYNVAYLDFRNYFKFADRITAKYRVAYRRAFSGFIPYYDYSLLGVGTVVRGHRNDIREGKGAVLGSVELSYAIIKEWHVSLDLPILPKRLTSARLGLRLNIYADTGTTYDELTSLNFGSFYSGYGLGLTILYLPFNALRLEYAWNEFGAGQWLIGTGFSF